MCRTSLCFGGWPAYFCIDLLYFRIFRFFYRGNDTARLAECYFMTENYGALEKMIVRRVPDTDPLLSTIAEMFASVGLCEQAVEAYTKRGQYVCPAPPSHSLPPKVGSSITSAA
jgi:hypothetical protein